ncbi:MAG: transcriptional regulator [Alphaproteobacteria bacterium]|nr:transcriptional regulator [Alphaproteobacteria bacterium]
MKATNPKAIPPAETVAACWGKDAPAWVRKLAAFCENEGQASVARRMKCSGSTVNMVLKNNYKASLDAIQKRFEMAVKDAVICPVLGEIDGGTCLDWQKKTYCPANHHVVRMYRACRSCPNNLKKGDPKP